MEYVYVAGLFWDARVFEDIEEMTRAELLEEYENELNMRGLEADPWVTRGRRRLIKAVTALRGERKADLAELMSMTRAELVSLAQQSGLPHRGWKKAEIAEMLLNGFAY